MAFLKPGESTFAAERTPGSAAATQAGFSISSNLASFGVVVATPVLTDLFGMTTVFFGQALVLTAFTLPLMWLIGAWLGVKREAPLVAEAMAIKSETGDKGETLIDEAQQEYESDLQFSNPHPDATDVALDESMPLVPSPRSRAESLRSPRSRSNSLRQSRARLRRTLLLSMHASAAATNPAS